MKNNCSFGKLDRSMPRGVTCGRVTKATNVKQRQKEEGSRGKSVLVFVEGHCIQMCAGLWSWEARLGRVIPFPLEASIATWEGLQNVISRSRCYPGIGSRIQNMKHSHICFKAFFWWEAGLLRGVLPFCQCWDFLFNAVQIQHSVLPEQSCNLMRKTHNFILLYFFLW